MAGQYHQGDKHDLGQTPRETVGNRDAWRAAVHGVPRSWTNWATEQQHSTVSTTQSCLTLCDPTDCSPPGSSVHGILQARTLEWVAIPFSRGSS